MSYDLMVFDPESAPRDGAAFQDWYAHQIEWAEGHSYDDVALTTPALRSWYQDIRKTFPNMNGPDAADDEHIDEAADYSIGPTVIYAAFPWSYAEEVYPLVRRLAEEHRVGFYDVSGDPGDPEIYFPGDKLRPESAAAGWREVARQFKELRNQ